MDDSFFWLSKILWMIASPDILLVCLLTVSLFFLCRKQYKTAMRCFSLLIPLMILITLFPIGDWLFYPLEKKFPPPKKLPESVGGIIVLAGAENAYKSFLWDQVELNHSAERFFAFIQLIKKYPHARAVFTGGTGSISRQDYKGAPVAKRLFTEQGLDISKIIFESQSKNTYENVVFTKKLVKPKPGERWILITSAAHMPRSFGIFKKIGWPVLPYSVDHNTYPKNLFRLTLNFSGNLEQIRWAVREWFGLAAYYLTGKTAHFLPGSADL